MRRGRAKTPDDLVVFSPSNPRDPDGSRLHAALGAEMGWEVARARRIRLAHAVAAASVPLGLLAARPDWAPARLRPIALCAWAFGLAGLLLALWSERGWRRKRARALTDLGPPPRLPPAP